MSKISSPRISPDISDAVEDMRIWRFKKYWNNPKQMTTRPFLSAWSLHVHRFEDLQNALDAAHALKCIHSLSFSYQKNNFCGTCVVPNSEIQ